jgi:hypothetical protein
VGYSGAREELRPAVVGSYKTNSFLKVVNQSLLSSFGGKVPMNDDQLADNNLHYRGKGMLGKT